MRTSFLLLTLPSLISLLLTTHAQQARERASWGSLATECDTATVSSGKWRRSRKHSVKLNGVNRAGQISGS